MRGSDSVRPAIFAMSNPTNNGLSCHPLLLPLSAVCLDLAFNIMYSAKQLNAVLLMLSSMLEKILFLLVGVPLQMLI